MSQILRRRLEKVSAVESLPDLLMVDGGKGQLGAALAVMQDLQLVGRMDVVGIAKKDPAKGRGKTRSSCRTIEPGPVRRDADLLLFLQRIRMKPTAMRSAFIAGAIGRRA